MLDPFGLDTSKAEKSDLDELRGMSEQKNVSSIDHDDRLHELIEVKRAINELEDLLAPKKKHYEALKEQVMAQMKGSGIKSHKTMDGSLISFTEKHQYSASDDNKRLFAAQYGQEASLTIHHQTFTKLVREVLVEQEQEIPGYIKEVVIENLSVRLK